MLWPFFRKETVVYKIIGRLSILIALLSIVFSFVPGAVSAIGFLISIAAVIGSIISTNSGSSFYFKISVMFVGIGLFAINDGLRLIGSLLGVSWGYQWVAYSLFIVICILGYFFSKGRSLVSISDDK